MDELKKKEFTDMKGTIIKCLKDMVINKFGQDKWHSILDDAGLSRSTLIMISNDIEDSQAIKLFLSTGKILNKSFVEVSDIFGDYWSNGYADKMYKHYYDRHKNIKDFLLDMDNVHIMVTDTMDKARPPRFKYTWLNDNTLIMNYSSQRNIIDLLAGLAKGAGKHYGANLKVTKLNDNQIQIEFPS